MNDGETAWPEGSVLKPDVTDPGDLLCAPDMQSSVQPVGVKEKCEVSLALIAPEQPGNYVAYFRLVDHKGQAFDGHRLWVDINVDEELSDWHIVGRFTNSGSGSNSIASEDLNVSIGQESASPAPASDRVTANPTGGGDVMPGPGANSFSFSFSSSSSATAASQDNFQTTAIAENVFDRQFDSASSSSSSNSNSTSDMQSPLISTSSHKDYNERLPIPPCDVASTKPNISFKNLPYSSSPSLFKPVFSSVLPSSFSAPAFNFKPSQAPSPPPSSSQSSPSPSSSSIKLPPPPPCPIVFDAVVSPCTSSNEEYAEWQAEIQYLASMGFTDLNIVIPLLGAHLKALAHGQTRPMSALEPIIWELIGSF